MDLDNPFITTIVAVLNGSQTLERCVKSIASQTYPNKELIVMDGGSTDASPSILKNYHNSIAHWESEPDRGIYHAWNKALQHANGEWVCFLGADDYFWSDDVLLDLAPHLKKAKDSGIKVVYGQVVKMDKRAKIIKMEGKPWRKVRWLMYHGMSLPHPGLMHHRSLFEVHGSFDETFRIAGDYELLLRELKNGQALYVSGVRTVGCQMGGVADTRKLLAQREVARARRKNGLPTFTLLWLAVYIRSLIRLQLRNIIGE